MNSRFDADAAADAMTKVNMPVDADMLNAGVNRDYDPDGLVFSGGEA